MKNYKTFDKTFWYWVIPLVVLTGIIFLLPWLITEYSWFGLTFNNTSKIGDALGGILGPFIAVIAAALTFIAFWVQYTFNKQQWQSIQIDRFENRVFEMLQLHRENVNELMVSDREKKEFVKGREVFPILFSELRFIYYQIQSFWLEFNIVKIEEIEKEKENLSIIAQLFFFIGISEGRNTLLKSKLQLILQNYKSVDIETLIRFVMARRGAAFKGIKLINGELIKLDLNILPGQGYVPKLGHYYRHLFQMVKYIVDYDSIIISDHDKYQYLKTIRAQLSSHEQLLLYYNALAPFGVSWITNGYLTKYKMIKNIPLPLADFGIKPEEKFANEILEYRKKGEELFEWKE